MRDDFSQKTKDILAKRAGQRCSNPNCPAPVTSGPHTDPNQAINMGEAAHISAASPGGKRYNDKLTSEQRSSILNGIWLCERCAKLIDTDELRFPEELLHDWKRKHEEKIFSQIYGSNKFISSNFISFVTSNLSIIPSRNYGSSIMLFELTNNHSLQLLIKSIELRVVEFRRIMPFGMALSSAYKTADISGLNRFNKKKIVRMKKVLDPNQNDSFGISLTAHRLRGLFCAWNMDICLNTNFGDILFKGKEIHIPNSRNGKEESFDEFRDSFKDLYYKNAAGMSWWQNKLVFRKSIIPWNGFTYLYMGGILYSGPNNFLYPSQQAAGAAK